MKLTDHGKGHARVGRLLLSWPVRSEGAPLLDGCTTVLVRDDKLPVEKVAHGGLVVRPLALAVTWRGARVPNPQRWRWRYLRRELVWRLKGRPSLGGVSMTVEGGSGCCPTPEPRYDPTPPRSVP